MQPRGDDDVAVWLKARRDEYGKHDDEWFAWNAINNLLDEWRLRADTGTQLSVPMPGEER